jgi:hypothetical protein
MGESVSFVQENAVGVSWVFPAASLALTQRIFDPSSLPVEAVILTLTAAKAPKVAPTQLLSSRIAN